MIEEAIAYYNDLFDDELAASTQVYLEAAMSSRHLNFGGRPLCTVLRPNFLTADQYAHLSRRCEIVLGAFRKAYDALLTNPTLRAQLDLTAEEEALIHLDPGYESPTPVSRLDSFLSHDGTLQFVEYNAETPAGAGYEDVLAEAFMELPVMQHFMRRYNVRKISVRGKVLETLLDCYRQWGGTDEPRIGIIDWENVPTRPEFFIFKEYFESQGVPAVIASPEEVEYRDGNLHAGDFVINIVYKRILAGELLSEYGLKHPIVAAVRDGAAVMVNPFRCKLLHKKTSFAVLSDEANAHLYSQNERRAIQAHIPWTRKVKERKTTYRIYRRALVDENKWRAVRYGLDGKLIDFGICKELPARDLLRELVEFVDEVLDDLGSREEVEYVYRILEEGSSADRQLATFRETGDMKAVVDRLVTETMEGCRDDVDLGSLTWEQHHGSTPIPSQGEAGTLPWKKPGMPGKGSES